jgi:hydroxyethylthiazole kinase-like uncharacterized protein yjeF
MQKIISGSEVKLVDELFIRDKEIQSLDLMESAGEAFCTWFITQFNSTSKVAVFCGSGNNGGDGLAICRILSDKGYSLAVFLVGDQEKTSPDFEENRKKLPNAVIVNETGLTGPDSLKADIIIDAVFGVGINKPLSGEYLQLIQFLNSYPATKVAVDLPSGLPADKVLDGEAFVSDFTVTFQFPKLSLLFPEHASYTGELVVLDIGISDSYFNSFSQQLYFVQRKDLAERHRRFTRFSHKGDFGKVMLIGGSYGKIGAIRFSSHAALRTGSGLVSCFLPRCGVNILQASLPEVMVESSDGEVELSKNGLKNLDRFDALGIGPGMGTGHSASECLQYVLENFEKPMVIDADGLNILAVNRHLLSLLRENILLTPHLVEFERLVGKSKVHVERMGKAKEFCGMYRCVLVLKGANTLITLPDGTQFFNSSGSQYMASGGSGDVLTGMLTSFLGQGYSPENAAICGVYHHGLAGELASKNRLRGTIPSDIVECIPKTFIELRIP